MKSFLQRFRREDDGAVTVDWVVITAGIVIFSATLGYYLRDATIDAGNTVGANVAAQVTP